MFQPSSIHPLRHFNVSPPVYLSFVLLIPLKSSSLIDTILIHLEEIRLQPELVPVADWAQRWISSGGTAVPHTPTNFTTTISPRGEPCCRRSEMQAERCRTIALQNGFTLLHYRTVSHYCTTARCRTIALQRCHTIALQNGVTLLHYSTVSQAVNLQLSALTKLRVNQEMDLSLSVMYVLLLL